VASDLILSINRSPHGRYLCFGGRIINLSNLTGMFARSVINNGMRSRRSIIQASLDSIPWGVTRGNGPQTPGGGDELPKPIM
jgi:hypothetical protein